MRFTCVPKRFRFIILSDPKFAETQFQAACERKTLTCRLLCTTEARVLESLDLETPSFGEPSTVRKLKFPYQPPSAIVSLLGSCNGIVFLVFKAFEQKIFYTWNPSTGFFKKMPDPDFSLSKYALELYGVGYLPAINDYKVFVVPADKGVAAIFSSRAQAWKKLHINASYIRRYNRGTLLKEALHWIDNHYVIVAFDLAQEEEHKFRKMRPPKFHDKGINVLYEHHLGVSAGGCLSLARYMLGAPKCIDVWVMREYNIRESWTKLYNFKVLDPPKELWSCVLLMETSMVAGIYVGSRDRLVIRILQKEEDKSSMYKVEGYWLHMIQYEESLLRLDD